jgi:hypothetical protein
MENARCGSLLIGKRKPMLLAKRDLLHRRPFLGDVVQKSGHAKTGDLSGEIPLPELYDRALDAQRM